MASMQRGVGFYCLILIAATAGSLFAAEVAIRTFHPVRLFAAKTDLVRVSPNPTLMYALNPDHPEHNRQGYRNGSDYSPAATKGTFRIAVVGDSTTYGYGSRSAESFPAQLEQLLNEPERAAGSGRGVEVLNFGIPGYSIIQEAEMLQTQVSGFAPDMVILAACLDDWAPYSGSELHSLVENHPHGGLFLDFLDPANGIARQILFNSHLYRRVLLLPRAYGVDTEPVRRDGDPIVEFYAEQGNWYGERFGRFQNALRGHRVQSVVALLPTREAGQGDITAAGRLYAEKLAELGSYCEEDGCRLIDVRDALAATDIYLPDGVHFSAAGNRALAAAIADNLEFR